MKISRFSIHRPVFTAMATSLVLVLGAMALTRIPIDLMPDITMPRISVNTNYENASPEEVEELITRPLEEALSAVTGVEELSSISAEGRSRVTVGFAWGTDVDVAVNDVRDRLDRVMGRLPDNAERPTVRKFNPAEFPVLILGTSSALDPLILRQLIEDEVKHRIERAPGVAALDVVGGLEREIHVDLDPGKLRMLGLSPHVIVERIRAGNLNLPAGSVYLGDLDVRIRTPGLYESLADLGETVIAVRGSASLRLRDIATVSDRWREVTSHILINGKPGVMLRVNKQSGTNTVDVVRGVLAEVERVNRDLPQLEIVPVINSATYIEQSISNMGRAAVFGAFFAVLVLLFFLRNLRSTVVMAVSIPVSVVATFLLIHFAGFTLNIMTIGGLALGMGMLLDNAIVVVENILRLHDEGLPRREAAVRGSEEVTSAILASTLTTIVVFLPVVFMRGMPGLMFRQLATVVAFALFCSLVVSIALVPMIASRIIHPTTDHSDIHNDHLRAWVSASDRFFTTVELGYRDCLHWALAHRAWVGLGCVMILGASITLIPFIGTELMPEADEGEVRVEGEMQVGTRLAVVNDTFMRMWPVVRDAVPEIETSQAFIGGRPWQPGSGNTAELRLFLVPRSERTRSDEDIAADLDRLLRGWPGVRIRTRKGSGFFLLNRAMGATENLAVEVRGHDLDTALALTREVVERVEAVPGVTDTRVSMTDGTPEAEVVVDRAKAEAMKVSVRDISEMLGLILSGRAAGDFREGGREYRILVKVGEARHWTPAEVLDMTVTNADGEAVVLRNVVEHRTRAGPVSIERKNQQRTISIRVNYRGRDMGSVAREIEADLRGMLVPDGFTLLVTGDYEDQQEAFRELLISIALALLLVYMVMACQFESLRDPFVVMFSVPLAAVGVILMLFLTGTTFNLQSFIGCITLAGIVVNNAILLVDQTNQLRRLDKMPLRAAIEEAGRRRLRPILMTATTTSLALVPLAIGLGEGGEAQAPMARAVIGGLLSSTLITLLLVPVVYSVFERKTKAGEPEPDPHTEPEPA